MDYATVIFRTIFFYFVVLILYRIMGKREVGQLGIVDLIVSILISGLVAISIEDYEGTIFKTLVPILILALLQVILAYISLKFPKTRVFLDGKPSVIIKNGRINFKEMSKQKYNLDDLLLQLRQNQVRSLEEVEYAILEPSGNLSIFRKLGEKTDYPFAIILDGVIQDDVLKSINKTEEDILKILENRNISLDNVFYAFYRKDRTFIIKRDSLK